MDSIPSPQTPEEIGKYINGAILKEARRLHALTGTTADHECHLTPSQNQCLTQYVESRLIVDDGFQVFGRTVFMGDGIPFEVTIQSTRTVPIEGVELEPVAAESGGAL